MPACAGSVYRRTTPDPIEGSSSGITTEVESAVLLYGDLHQSQPDLQLVKLGCSGETTTTFLAGGLCSYGAFGGQLGAAVAFLLAHRGHVQLVTINLGGNDIGGCADLSGIDYDCVRQSTNQVRVKLSVAMAARYARRPAARRRSLG